MTPQPERSPQDVIAANALLSGLTSFSARFGHDLLGPLNRAGSLVALFINRHKGQLDPEADRLLEFLQNASSSMEGVAAGVRKYMEIAARPPNLGPVDLNVSLSSSLKLLEKAISASGAVIVSDELAVASADALQMVTLFEILIGNSIKFRKAEAPPRIQISIRRVGEILHIGIADNGIGIEPEHRETVFLPFRRLNGAEYEGAGLGLATAKLIAEMQGGNIRIVPHSDGTNVQFTVRSR